jgi:adenosylcobinamide hydrolase
MKTTAARWITMASKQPAGASRRRIVSDITQTRPATTIDGIRVTVDERAVRVASDRPLTAVSSAMIGGGLVETRDILNMHVEDVHLDSQPENDLRAFASTLGITGPFIGLMTAAKTQHARLAEASCAGLKVAALASVGLSNRVCAGVSPPVAADAGTINTLVLVDAALTPPALINAVITTTEAKTLALASWDVRTTDGLPASGTSTDAVVVACTGRGTPLDYAGPSTSVGWLIARTVRQAIERICSEQVERDGGRRIGW